MARLSTSPVAAGSIVAGYLVARRARRRATGVLVLAPAGAWCATRWRRQAGPGAAAGLVGVYLAAVGGSHPLARKLGTWPSVLAVSAATGLAAWVVADRRTLPAGG